MVDGNTLWGTEITGDMIETEASGNYGKIFPDLPKNLFEAMKKTAGCYPKKTALIDDRGSSCTYQCFLKRCEEFAAYLHGKKKISKGTHVGIMMHNTIEYCVSFYALSRIGAVMISLPSKFKKTEVLALARQSDMEFLICEKEYGEWFEDFFLPEQIVSIERGENEAACFFAEWETQGQDKAEMALLPSGDTDSPAIMMFTSGTTSKSKVVLLKNSHIMHGVEAYRRIFQITERDSSVIATPIYHITGLVALLGLFLTAGGTLYLHCFFDAKRLLQDVQAFGITFLHASPTVFHLFWEAGEERPELPNLRAMACGSSNMAKEKILRLHQWLPNAKFHTVYGLTETSSPATIFPGDAALSPYLGSSGRPIPGIYFKIVDENGQELPRGIVGEVAVRGSNVLEAYYGQTAEALRDGWLYTGDLGYFNEEDYLYIVDRKKNMINRGGEKIWCYDVENELESIPEICNAAVVGIPDDLYGEVAAAAIRLEQGKHLGEEDIKIYLKTKMAKYKIPVKIKILDHIPQTPNGKPDKEQIKKMMMEA